MPQLANHQFLALIALQLVPSAVAHQQVAEWSARLETVINGPNYRQSHWGILVNAVAPGLIETDMAAALPTDARDALLAQVPLKRIGTAREVAEMVGFLAGDGAAYVTGQVFHVNGGLYM